LNEAAAVNEKAALHSRYNPVVEAERYIDSLSIRQRVRFFILIEPGLDYLTPLLQKKFPAAKSVALHIEEENVQAFLGREIPDTEASSIEIIEWRPSMAKYGGQYLRLLRETAAFIKRADANKRTTRYFGRRWFLNFFRNSTRMEKALVFERGGFPCIVAAAGPCLEASLPLIKELQQQRAFVLAASSATGALLKAGIVADMVVATDGGNWALFHLYESLRSVARFAISARAAIPSNLAAVPLLFISDENWQKAVFKAFDIPFISLPQRGTVSASALDLAFALTSGPVFIAGIDLANDDIRTHARPYALDFQAASRFEPQYSAAFIRARALAGGGSFTVYEQWFHQQLPRYPRRLYTIGTNNAVFSSLKSWEAADWDSHISRNPFHTLVLPTDRRVQTIAETLICSLQNDEAVRTELSALLFSGDSVSQAELIEEIRSYVL
jgi:hypothetical protein